MSTQDLGLASSEQVDGETVSIDLRGLEAAQRSLSERPAEEASPLAVAAREQLARDIADIEKATAALRRAEPGLETWIRPTAAAANPRPLWLLIGALWLSTAIVTAGAVVAIATLAG
jgi:hypothetical protein